MAVKTEEEILAEAFPEAPPEETPPPEEEATTTPPEDTPADVDDEAALEAIKARRPDLFEAPPERETTPQPQMVPSGKFPTFEEWDGTDYEEYMDARADFRAEQREIARDAQESLLANVPETLKPSARQTLKQLGAAAGSDPGKSQAAVALAVGMAVLQGGWQPDAAPEAPKARLSPPSGAKNTVAPAVQGSSDSIAAFNRFKANYPALNSTSYQEFMKEFYDGS